MGGKRARRVGKLKIDISIDF
jgi:T-box protein 6